MKYTFNEFGYTLSGFMMEQLYCGYCDIFKKSMDMAAMAHDFRMSDVGFAAAFLLGLDKPIKVEYFEDPIDLDDGNESYFKVTVLDKPSDTIESYYGVEDEEDALIMHNLINLSYDINEATVSKMYDAISEILYTVNHIKKAKTPEERYFAMIETKDWENKDGTTAMDALALIEILNLIENEKFVRNSLDRDDFTNERIY